MIPAGWSNINLETISIVKHLEKFSIVRIESSIYGGMYVPEGLAQFYWTGGGQTSKLLGYCSPCFMYDRFEFQYGRFCKDRSYHFPALFVLRRIKLRKARMHSPNSIVEDRLLNKWCPGITVDLLVQRNICDMKFIWSNSKCIAFCTQNNNGSDETFLVVYL